MSETSAKIQNEILEKLNHADQVIGYGKLHLGMLNAAFSDAKQGANVYLVRGGAGLPKVLLTEDENKTNEQIKAAIEYFNDRSGELANMLPPHGLAEGDPTIPYPVMDIWPEEWDDDNPNLYTLTYQTLITLPDGVKPNYKDDRFAWTIASSLPSLIKAGGVRTAPDPTPPPPNILPITPEPAPEFRRTPHESAPTAPISSQPPPDAARPSKSAIPPSLPAGNSHRLLIQTEGKIGWSKPTIVRYPDYITVRIEADDQSVTIDLTDPNND